MKVLFTSLNSKYIHSNLAIRYLSKCLSSACVKVEEYTINEDTESIFYRILSGGYDMVAFSCYIWNIESTLKLAQTLKKARPELMIVFGGPEVSFETKELMQKHPAIDLVVAGEGEKAFFALDRALGDHTKSGARPFKACEFIAEREALLFEIPNLFYRKGDAVCNLSDPKKMEEEMVTQDLSIVPRAYDPIEPSEIRDRIVYYETSRGCTYNCSYCLSATSKGVRYFDEKRVYEELSELVRAGAKQIKFVDRTFNADSARAERMIDKMLALDDGQINFHFEITAHLLQQNILSKLQNARTGLFQFEIGVQSTNPDTLLAINRGGKLEKLEDNVRRIKSIGNIHQHLDLIAGLPYESKARFIESFDRVFALRPDALQLGFLKMLKGSPIYHQAAQYGYVYRDYPPYEIIANRFITAEELYELKCVENMVDRYYNKGRYRNSLGYLADFFKEDGYALFYALHRVIEDERIDLSKKNEEFRGLALLAERLVNATTARAERMCAEFAGARERTDEREHKDARDHTGARKRMGDGDRTVIDPLDQLAAKKEWLCFFSELLRLDYLLMGRNPNVPDFLKAENLARKEEIFELLKDGALLRALGFDENTAPKEAFKKIGWSNFEYDVLQYMKNKKIKKQSTTVIINYAYPRRGDESFAAVGRKYESKA